ncbi:hypothetical protein OROHE_014015 [Orobanche hederae]
MSNGLFNRGKGKGKAITCIPRRGRGGASGSGTPAHTPIPSSNSISSSNFGDYVPEDITEEQINKMFEVSKSIHNIEDNEDDEQEQPTKPKQKKPSELKSPLFAVLILSSSIATIAIKYTSLEKEEVTGHSMAICKDNIPIKLASSLIKPNFEARRRRLMPSIEILNDLVQNAKNSLSALYCEYACNYSGSLDLGTGSISSFGFAIPDLGERNAYQEDLSRRRTRYQSNAYQELENYLTTFDLGALECGPDGNNSILSGGRKAQREKKAKETSYKNIAEMRKFDPWPVFFRREWNRNWPFLVGFAITGTIITKLSLGITEEEAKNSPFVQRHNRKCENITT